MVKSATIIIVLVCIVIIPIYADDCTNTPDCSCWTFVDTSIVDALWIEHLMVQAGLGVSIAPGVDIELPCTYTFDRQGGHEQLVEFLLELKYHPWGSGPFIGVSLAHISLFIGPYVPLEYVHYLNSISFGYTYRFAESFYVEPVLVCTDPSDSFEESYSYIHALIPTFPRFRFRLRFGWIFAEFSSNDSTN